jgi:beta-lactamase class A
MRIYAPVLSARGYWAIPICIIGVIAFLLGRASVSLPVFSTNTYGFTGHHYTYISPLLECGDSQGILPKDAKNAEQAVRAIIAAQKDSGSLDTIGVYYRDLHNGPTFSVDAGTKFSPGSLLKIPVMMAAYKKSVSDPSFLSTRTTYAGPTSATSHIFTVADPIVEGKTYTTLELMEHMIWHSDNNATIQLYKTVGFDSVVSTYTDLGYDAPVQNEDYLISVRDYSTLFRVLYNATYLPPRQSEEALSQLTKSDFKQGIVAGVPEGVIVAHKFGERELPEEGMQKQLHDCGIVYKKDHPYLLCIMSRGTDFQSLEKTISDISKAVYDAIDAA